MHAHDHQHIPLHPNFTHGSTVLGHAVTLPPLDFRFAAEHELETDGQGPVFACEQPVVLYAPWSMNLAEYIRCVAAARGGAARRGLRVLCRRSSVPLTLYKLAEKGVHIDQVVQFVPEKLPLESFNRWILQAFAKQPPVSLSEFSAMKTPHGNCFEEVILLKVRSCASTLCAGNMCFFVD